MKAYLAGFSALACMLAGSLAVAQTQRALLIGINTYQPAEPPPIIRRAASMAAANWEPLRILTALSTTRRLWPIC